MFIESSSERYEVACHSLFVLFVEQALPEKSAYIWMKTIRPEDATNKYIPKCEINHVILEGIESTPLPS